MACQATIREVSLSHLHVTCSDLFQVPLQYIQVVWPGKHTSLMPSVVGTMRLVVTFKVYFTSFTNFLSPFFLGGGAVNTVPQWVPFRLKNAK